MFSIYLFTELSIFSTTTFFSIDLIPGRRPANDPRKSSGGCEFFCAFWMGFAFYMLTDEGKKAEQHYSAPVPGFEA